MYIYYPSCNFQRLFPETAKRVRAYLETQPDVRIAGCCHATYAAAQAGDVIVTVCMSCMRILDERRKDVKGVSLYELLLTRGDFPWPDLRGQVFTLQDCFRARGKHALHSAVRECLIHTGATVIEMPCSRDEETFDGVFLWRAPNPICVKEAPGYFDEYLSDHLTLTPEEQWRDGLVSHARQYETKRVIGYCNTCVTGARQGGAEALHLAELLFA